MGFEDRVSQLEAGHEKWIEGKKRNWTPSRNSSYNIGHACDRYLVHERLDADKKPPVDNGLQEIFEEGHDQEQAVIAYLLELGRMAGFKIVSQQTNVSTHRDNISARIDVRIQFNDSREIFPVEIKTMNPNLFAKFRSLEDFKNSDRSYHKMYPAQVMSYLFHDGSEKGFVLLKDKASKRVRWIPIGLDYVLMNEIQVKADRIDRYVAKREYPKPIAYDPVWCDDCLWRKSGLCPIGERLKDAKLIDSPTIEEKLNIVHQLNQTAKEAKKADDQVKGWLKTLAHDHKWFDGSSSVSAICGNFEITMKDTGKVNNDGTKSIRISFKKMEVENGEEAAQ